MDKYNLKFLIPPDFVEYDLMKPMGADNPGGGVALKYARVEQAGHPDYNCKRVGSIDEINANEVVFADWMWFCVADSPEESIDRAKEFMELPNRKLIYGSEFCIATMPGALIRQVVDAADMILHNTQHQKNLYKTLGIYTSELLCDPVPPIFAPSLFKKRRLVCVGQISPAKNTEAAIRIFKALEGTGIERYFIGGAVLWGVESLSKRVIELRDELASCADEMIENVPQIEVAQICNESSFYGHYAYHDVSSYAGQENGSAGNVIFGLRHPVLKERHTLRFEDPESLAEAMASYHLDSERHNRDLEKTLQVASGWSHEAWRDQMGKVLRKIT